MAYLFLLATDASATMQTGKFFYENWIIIKQLIQVFGWFMGLIMKMLDKMGIYNIALCIILFTIVTKFVLLPFTIKQQKSSRLTMAMQPELQALQKKYRGRNDQASRQKMMMEQQEIQEKYGVSTFAGCLPLLLQMPILFSFYPVIYRMDEYVKYLGVLRENLPEETFVKMWTFLGLNLQEAPGFSFTPAILIPILVAVSQYLTTKLMTARQKTGSNQDNPMASSMNTMNIMMPLMLGFFAIKFPMFLGIYWIVQSLVTAGQQLVINKFLDKVPLETVIAEAQEKAAKKKKNKKETPIGRQANTSTRNIAASYQNKAEESTESGISQEEKEEQIRKATEYYASRSAAPGSLAAKANMVREYNERNKKN